MLVSVPNSSSVPYIAKYCQCKIFLKLQSDLKLNTITISYYYYTWMKKAVFSYRKTFHFFLWIRSKPPKMPILRFFYLHITKENIQNKINGSLTNKEYQE